MCSHPSVLNGQPSECQHIRLQNRDHFFWLSDLPRGKAPDPNVNTTELCVQYEPRSVSTDGNDA